MVRRHRRFELLNVALGEIPIGSCTIDLWEVEDGSEQWSARVLMKSGHGSTEGVLVGQTRDGRTLQGRARFAADQQGPRGGRTVLVELHGQGPLAEAPAGPVPPPAGSGAPVGSVPPPAVPPVRPRSR